MKKERNAILRKKETNNNDLEEILRLLQEIKADCQALRNRMVSLESWMAALSKGKDLSKSHSFAKDIHTLKETLAPTIEIEYCK